MGNLQSKAWDGHLNSASEKNAQIQECAEAQKLLTEGSGKTIHRNHSLNQDLSLQSGNPRAALALQPQD